MLPAERVKSENIVAQQTGGVTFPASGTAVEKLRFFVKYARFAPSNHNAQPWTLRFRNGRLDLFADRSRSLPASDPFDRELTISCGAFLGTLETVAHGFGCLLNIQHFPDRNDDDYFASISLKSTDEGVSNEILLRAILERRTNRGAFDETPVTADQKEMLALAADPERASVIWIEDPADKASLARMVMDADRAQFENPSFLRELASWLRAPNSAARDGLPASIIGISGVAAYVAPLVVRTFDVGEGKAARDQELVKGSAAFAVFSTPEDRPRDWLLCGEALAAFLICAQQCGLKVSYLNQPCEVEDIRFRLSLLEPVHGNPQLVLRVGHNQFTPPPTARREFDVA